MTEVILSTRNEHARFWRSLQEKKFRKQEGLFLLEGEHCVQEAVKSSAVLREILLTEGEEEKYSGLCEAASSRGIRIVHVSQAVMESVTDTRTPQGITAVAELIAHPFTSALRGGFWVVLENLQDPGNIGTIIRTADAAGVSGVILGAGCADVHSPKVVRATMGSLFHMPILTAQNVPEAVRLLREAGWQTVCGHLAGKSFYREPLADGNLALVIGNEGNGITAETAEACNTLLKLPMSGRAESLNAAMAAGIMIYEIARQRGILEE